MNERYDIENELVAQKDRIIGLINHDRYDEATLVLTILSPLWVKAGYGYKIAELAERITKAREQRKVKRVKIVKRNDEYVVQAYDQHGQRYPECDYYTDDKGDAEQTKDRMLNGSDY